MERYPDIAWDDLRAAFEATVGSMDKVLPLNRALPTFMLRRSDDAALKARVEEVKPGEVVVELGGPFLAQLAGMIEGVDELDLAALVAVEAVADAPEAEDVRIALHGLVRHFVVQHELFHVLGGHLAHLAATSRKAITSLIEPGGLQLSGKGRNSAETGQIELARYRELEADNSALQIMVDHCSFGDLAAALKQPEAVPITDHDGTDRILAFRIMFAAAWLVLLALERDQEADVDLSYPWPAARLLSLLSTLLLHYTGDKGMREDQDSQRYLSMSGQTIEPTREFLTAVAGPVVKFMVTRTDAAAVVERFRRNEPGPSALLDAVMRDLKDLLLDGPIHSAAGRQLLELQSKRRRYNELFAPYRMFVS
jgi:hypothetical protein